MQAIKRYPESIPRPSYKSWMFKRFNIPNKFKVSKKRYSRSSKQYYYFNYFVGHLVKSLKLHKNPYVFFRVLSGFMKFWFKIINRLSITGKENVPKEGCIFYVNHPGSLDPVLLQIAFGKPIGCFVSFDNFYFLDIMEKFFGLINKQKVLNDKRIANLSTNKRDVLMECMVRNIILKNRYFAIWPTGSLSRTGKVKQGFSSVARVYSAINSTKNRIPLVPVLIRGSQCYHIGLNPKLRPKFDKVSLHFGKPYYISRDWLQTPEEGSKTPREIVDYMMTKLARMNGQQTFIKNDSLEWAKSRFNPKKQ